MYDDTKAAELMERVEQQLKEFELLVPQLRALGDVEISISAEIIEEICRPTVAFTAPLPNRALRA